MQIEAFSFGSITIGGKTYDHDVVIDRGTVRRRDKKPSKELEHRFGHTPLSIAEKIPWDCRRLVVGTGAHGRLPVSEEVVEEAKHRGVELVMKPTSQVMNEQQTFGDETNAILHVTC